MIGAYRGKIYYSQGNYQDALTTYEKAAQIDPGNGTAWVGIGIALHNLNRSDEAVQALYKGLELSPENAYAWSYMEFPLNKLGRYQEAVWAYDNAIRIDPMMAGAWYNRGVTLTNSQARLHHPSTMLLNLLLIYKNAFECIRLLRDSLLQLRPRIPNFFSQRLE